MRIQAEHLSFHYNGKYAVQDISLNIPSGTLTVLCGVNGSGKSTLLRLLAGLEHPASGNIIHEDMKPADHKAGEAVAMVFQQPETQLFADSVHKDIEYGLTQRGVPKVQRDGIIRSALARTGLPYDEFAGRSPFLLSGGEKRRVCIAGAIASRPGLLILDEPTAGLDPQAAQSLLEMVQELRQSGLTLIIGTHDLDSFLPVADGVIVMKQGAVHYDGPAAALTADPGLLRAAGLTPPAYASIGRRLVERGWLEALPDNLEELLAGLDKQPLPVPQSVSIPAAAHKEPSEWRRSVTESPPASGDAPGLSAATIGPASGDAPGLSAATIGPASGDAPGLSAATIGPASGDAPDLSAATPGPVSEALASTIPQGLYGEPATSDHLSIKQAPGRLRWQGLDPRVKWLGMIIGSLTVLGMDTFLPLLLAASLLAGLTVSAGISWRRVFRFFRPFLLMFLFLWLLSGLSWNSPGFSIGPLSFSSAGLQRGGISVLRFLLLIVLGFLFTETTTGAPLREGLEWGIAPLRHLGIRTRNWSLAVSVTLQFVPWILGKLTQLQLALSSRGRRARGLARWSPRQIALIIVPLIILVLGMGDELATAVESRGYDPAKQRTPVYQLAWNKRDTWVALGILTAAGLLWWVARIS
ncbi:ATP-binding cassette domain-containing protein [Paenibacillus sp. FSL P4-0081]|uniref:ATP-binding cassette domain-containing protein n=1 Tax=Paenibacillus sp. FSL P4-0081 TaxID=1536769 RepID=UPI000694655C|nr:ATP-binding cassette domain-containing protein [Paenibacillus sp. FSL P4-0081]